MTSEITLLRRTCRQVAAVLIAREDRALSLPDSVALKLHLLTCSPAHLLTCKTCPKFENQVLTMRAAMDRWRNYAGEVEDAAEEAASGPSGRGH